MSPGRRTTGLALLALALGVPLAAEAHEYRAGSVRIVHPYAVVSLEGAANGVAYVDLTNRGAAVERLLGASTAVAARVEIHRMVQDGDVMRMRALDQLNLPAGHTVRMAESGLHLMLLELKQPLRKGDVVPVTLQFERAGAVAVDFWVQEPAQGRKAMDAHHVHR